MTYICTGVEVEIGRRSRQGGVTVDIAGTGIPRDTPTSISWCLLPAGKCCRYRD